MTHAMRMKRTILAAMLLSGCGVPLPEGVELDADRAVTAALSVLGPSESTTVVIGVPWNCTEETPAGKGYGFKRPGDGMCVGGLEKDGVIYLMLHDDVRYSHVLCHEVQHFLRGDGEHRRTDLWTSKIDECNAHLRETLGESDFIAR